jgi:hypothetical protein
MWDLTGPLALIGAGVVLLLNTTGRLPWSIWADAWRYWPVLLIVWGVLIFFGRGSRAFGALVGIAFIFFGAFVVANIASQGAVWREGGSWSPDPRQTRELRVDYDEHQPSALSLDVSFEGSDVVLRTVPSDQGRVLTAHATYYPRYGEPELRSSRAGTELEVSYSMRKFRQYTSLFTNLSPGLMERHVVTLGRPDLPTSARLAIGSGNLDAVLDQVEIQMVRLTVGSGVGTLAFPTPLSSRPSVNAARVDFEVGSGRVSVSGLGNIEVDRMRAHVGSGRATVDLCGPVVAGTVYMDVDVGSGELAVFVPKEMAVSADVRTGSGTLRVDEQSFTGKDSGGQPSYRSEGYEEASIRLDLRGHVGTGSVSIWRSK